MLRRIMRFLMATLRRSLRLAEGLLSTLWGVGHVEVIDDEPPDSGSPSPEPLAGHMREYRKTLETRAQATAIVAYAADAQVTGQRPPPPKILTRVQRDWLSRLSPGDLALLTHNGVKAVEAHIGNGPYVTGLWRVLDMPRKDLRPAELAADLIEYEDVPALRYR